MNIRKILADPPGKQLTNFHRINISEFNNVWNKLALELARPRLVPESKVDEERVKELRRRLIEIEPNNSHAYYA